VVACISRKLNPAKDGDLDLVGFDLPATCVRTNPVLFKGGTDGTDGTDGTSGATESQFGKKKAGATTVEKGDVNDGDVIDDVTDEGDASDVAASSGSGSGDGGMLFSCWAIGGQDRTLTVWTTKNVRPLVAIRDVRHYLDLISRQRRIALFSAALFVDRGCSCGV
jgi:hypothetical protein